MEDKPNSTTPVDPPRGFFKATVDDKGRLKVPVNMQTHMTSFGTDQLFVTSTDGRRLSIYTISAWKQNEKVLEDLRKTDPDAADGIEFMANHYGEESKIDPQGRVTLPTDVRRELALEGQPVRLSCTNGVIQVYSEAEYEAQMRQHSPALSASVKVAKQNGFR